MASETTQLDTRVVVVSGLKGGVGKSTAAIFLAFVYAILRGKRVLFVDADPSSQTGWDWHAQAADRAAAGVGKALPWDIEIWPHAQVGEMVKRRALGKYDVVVIDCGGDSDKILSAAMEVAHFALMVTSPSKTDMRRLRATYEAALNAAKLHGRLSEIDAAVLLTKVDARRGAQDSPEARHNQKMRKQIRDAGMDLLTAELSFKESVYGDSNGHCVDDPGDLAEAAAVVDLIEDAFAA